MDDRPSLEPLRPWEREGFLWMTAAWLSLALLTAAGWAVASWAVGSDLLPRDVGPAHLPCAPPASLDGRCNPPASRR